DNAFLAVDDVAALQTAADRLSPEIIRKRLDYWTLVLGPKFSAKERKQLNLSRFYAISQIEYAATLFSSATFPSTSCSSEVVNSACGGSPPTRLPRSSAPVCTAGTAASSPPSSIKHGHHVFRAYFKSAFLKQYEKFSTFLRNELCSNNLTDFGL